MGRGVPGTLVHCGPTGHCLRSIVATESAYTKRLNSQQWPSGDKVVVQISARLPFGVRRRLDFTRYTVYGGTQCCTVGTGGD